MRIVGLCGSLRAASYNRGLMRAAGESLPAGVTLDAVEIGTLPLMNQDLEVPRWPDSVMAFRRALWGADAFLFVTPEYNAGIPAPLKNAIDWGSRAEGGANRTAPEAEARPQPWQDRPAAVMGATPGQLGTARAQAHLRTVLLNVGIRLMPGPDVYVGGAGQKFTDGALTDDGTRAFLGKAMAALVAWTERVRA
jgi:chromate reductase, NAD(P)H dehydrogenase (quinone)